jgi:hypothetical protein
MDERLKIWNILHDGEITAASEDGDTFTRGAALRKPPALAT